MHLPDGADHDRIEFLASLGALLRSAERSGVELTEPRTVASDADGRYWQVEIDHVAGGPPGDRYDIDLLYRSTDGGEPEHPLDGSTHDERAFVATLGALIRSAERSSVELETSRTVAGIGDDDCWTVEFARLGTTPSDGGRRPT